MFGRKGVRLALGHLRIVIGELGQRLDRAPANAARNVHLSQDVVAHELDPPREVCLAR